MTDTSPQARVTIKDFTSTTKQRRKAIASWLRKVALDIENAETLKYVKNPKWSLFK